MDTKFVQDIATPYFKSIFVNLSARSMSPKMTNNNKLFIDNVAFFEYAKLPGIICDRFYSTFERTSEGNFILESQFVDGFIKVFHSSLHEKMK